MSDCSHITNQQILELLFVIAPQFATTDPVKLQSYNALIDALRCTVNCKRLGCCALLAFANLVAHYLTMQSNPLMGVGTSLSEGQLSIGLSSTTNGNFFGSTPYGQAYQNFLSKIKLTPYVTNSIPVWRGPAGC